MSIKNAIIGYSGHAYVVLDTCIQQNIIVPYYCDIIKANKNPFELQYIGDETSLLFDWDLVDNFILGIGDNNIRERVYSFIKHKDKRALNIIDSLATVKSNVIMGEGNYLSTNIVLNTLVSIGNACIINTGAIVEHECHLGDYVHIGPGAVLAGNVQVGNNTFIGANTVVKQGVKIGAHVVVGAGAVVLKDIPDHEIWIGNPAKKYK